MICLGLRCIFREVPIKFHTTTATANKRFSSDESDFRPFQTVLKRD
jgi:hypothetical protein